MLVVGCTNSSTPPSPSSSRSASSASAGTSSTGEIVAAKAQVLAVYCGYWAAKVQVHAFPDKPIPATLKQYAIDKAMTDTQATMIRLRQQGIRFLGEPTLSPTVTALQLGERANASISDCVDSSNWNPVFVATGKSALAPGQPTRVIVESTARTYAGRWVVELSVAHRDRTC